MNKEPSRKLYKHNFKIPCIHQSGDEKGKITESTTSQTGGGGTTQVKTDLSVQSIFSMLCFFELKKDMCSPHISSVALMNGYIHLSYYYYSNIFKNYQQL